MISLVGDVDVGRGVHKQCSDAVTQQRTAGAVEWQCSTVGCELHHRCLVVGIEIVLAGHVEVAFSIHCDD